MRGAKVLATLLAACVFMVAVFIKTLVIMKVVVGAVMAGIVFFMLSGRMNLRRGVE